MRLCQEKEKKKFLFRWFMHIPEETKRKPNSNASNMLSMNRNNASTLIADRDNDCRLNKVVFFCPCSSSSNERIINVNGTKVNLEKMPVFFSLIAQQFLSLMKRQKKSNNNNRIKERRIKLDLLYSFILTESSSCVKTEDISSIFFFLNWKVSFFRLQQMTKILINDPRINTHQEINWLDDGDLLNIIQ